MTGTAFVVLQIVIVKIERKSRPIIDILRYIIVLFDFFYRFFIDNGHLFHGILLFLHQIV